MNAKQCRQAVDNNKAMSFIMNAIQLNKMSVEIPKNLVNRQHLTNLGYTVTGGTHQRAETCNVSWVDNSNRRF